MEAPQAPEPSLASFDLEALLREPLPLYTSFPDLYHVPGALQLYLDDDNGDVAAATGDPGSTTIPGPRDVTQQPPQTATAPARRQGWTEPGSLPQLAQSYAPEQLAEAHIYAQESRRATAAGGHVAGPAAAPTAMPPLAYDPAQAAASWGVPPPVPGALPTQGPPSSQGLPLPQIHPVPGVFLAPPGPPAHPGLAYMPPTGLPVLQTSASEPGTSSAPSSNGETPRTVVDSGKDVTGGHRKTAGPPAAGSRQFSNVKGGGAPTGIASKDEETQERIRAKNRRAQTRYRAKLKARAQSTAEAHSKVADEVARLRLENQQLTAANDVMERVLTVRDGYVDILKSTQEPFAQRLSAIGTVTDVAHHNPKEETLSFEESQLRCPLTGLTRAEIRAIKDSAPSTAAVGWRELVPRLEDALSQLDSPSASQNSQETARAEILLSLRDARTLCFEHAVFRPSNVQRLMALNLDAMLLRPEDAEAGSTSNAPEPPPGSSSRANASHWRKVARTLGITLAQRAVMIPVGEVFLRRITRVMTARRDILARLTEATTSTGGNRGPVASGSGSVAAGQSSGGAAGSSPIGSAVAVGASPSLAASPEEAPHELIMHQRQTSEWLRTNELSGELRANLQLEHVACMEFVARTFGDALDSVQKARAIVNSYPFFPDMYSIILAIARDPSLLVPSDSTDGLLGTCAALGAPSEARVFATAASKGEPAGSAVGASTGESPLDPAGGRPARPARPSTSDESLESSGGEAVRGSNRHGSLDASSAINASDSAGEGAGDSSPTASRHDSATGGSAPAVAEGNAGPFVPLHVAATGAYGHEPTALPSF